MELHTINQNEAGIRLGMADYYNGYKMSIPNTSMKIAGESIEDLHISDRIPHILRGTYLSVSNADVTRPCEIIGLQGGSATGTNEIKVDILPIQIADTTRDGLSITRDDRDITINGKCEPTGTIKTGTTVTHSNATDWARLNSFTNTNVSTTVENTSFTLTDASSTKQASILELQGQTTQTGTPTPSNPIEVQTVSGDNNIAVSNKNLFNGETELGTFNNTTGQKSASSNTRRSVNPIIVQPNTQYIFSRDGTAFAVRVYYYKHDGTYLSTVANSEGKITTPNECYYMNFISDRILTNYDKLQLEKGFTATTYTEHQGNSYRVDLGGKNLLNIKDNLRDSASNGITAVYNNDNSITISGQATSNYAYLSNAINCTLPIGTYTLSIDKKLPHRTYINCKYTDNTSGNYIIETNTLTKTFTTSKIIQTVTLILSDIVSGTTYNETIYFQLEEGSQVTQFSPYTANPIELCKIGNYQDKIYYDSGKWYIEKQVGKVVINQNSSFNVQEIITNNNKFIWRYTSAISMVGSGNRATLLCNYFEGNTNIWSTNNLIGCYVNSNGMTNFAMLCSTVGGTTSNTKAELLSMLSTWLTTNNIIMYYPLATPTTTEITDTYLLNQLNALKNISLYDTLCYVDWIGIEAPTMKLFYNYLKLTGTHNLTVRKADLVDTYPITFDGDYELDEGDTIAFTNGEWQFNGTAITDTDLVTQLNATRHMDLFQNTNYITLNNDVTLTVAIIPNSVDFVLAQDENGLFSVKHGDVLFIDKQGYGIKLQFKIGNSYFTLADTDGVINYTGTSTRVIKRILLTIPTDTSISNDLARFRLYRGTEADNTYPITLGSLVIGNGDYLHNEAGKWKLNTTEITDSTLLANLRAIERLKLHDGETNYINWHGTDKITMILQYFYKEGDSE